MMRTPPIEDNIIAFLEAAENLAQAKVRYSQEWQRAYYIVKSDWHATQIATEKTKDEVTILRAVLKVAEERMTRE